MVWILSLSSDRKEISEGLAGFLKEVSQQMGFNLRIKFCQAWNNWGKDRVEND